MNIKQAKNEVIRTVRAYLEKRDNGEYVIPVIRQRPAIASGSTGYRQDADHGTGGK